MTWQDYALARQFLVETHIGTRVREQQQAETTIAKRSQQAMNQRK